MTLQGMAERAAQLAGAVAALDAERASAASAAGRAATSEAEFERVVDARVAACEEAALAAVAAAKARRDTARHAFFHPQSRCNPMRLTFARWWRTCLRYGSSRFW